MNRLAIVIVNFNARAHLEACLASLVSFPPATSHAIVVVDNASSDGSAAAVRARFPEVLVHAQTENRGFAAANNAGVRSTASELVLLLNSDTIVPPGALDALVLRLDANPGAAVAGPRLVGADGQPELSFGPMISPLGELRQKAVLALQRRGFDPVTSWIRRVTDREHDVDWVSGACLLVRRAAAETVGLLDERYFLYTEDVDFCAAIRARGHRVLFTPAAEVVHLRGRSRATAPAASNAAYRRSQVAFYEKHHPVWAPVLRLYLRLKRQLPR
jgi:N-acetylglucosaminyl-diphospho-decaprenol L-rhamnosyltransferase